MMMKRALLALCFFVVGCTALVPSTRRPTAEEQAVIDCTKYMWDTWHIVLPVCESPRPRMPVGVRFSDKELVHETLHMLEDCVWGFTDGTHSYEVWWWLYPLALEECAHD